MASEINNFVGDDYMSVLYVLDSTYDVKYTIDIFIDLLWTERYCGYGEFEITVPYSKELLASCGIDDYVSIRESNVIMIIDTIGISSDVVSGASVKISGRSLESLLDRRIIADKAIGTIDSEGNPNPIGLQEAMKTLLNNNVIQPDLSVRRIPNFSFKESTDTRITRLQMDAFQERGTIIYDKLLKVCQDNDLGFRVNAVGSGGFQFELYVGTDRSWDQTAVPTVLFSTSYENLNHSDYLKSDQSMRNVIYIDWKYKFELFFPEDLKTFEFSGNDISEIYSGEAVSGLARRETYMEDSTEYSAGTYVITQQSPTYKLDTSGVKKQVANKGKEELALNKSVSCFEGDVEYNRQFIYGVDYFVGDIVQLENEYSLHGKCRITELVRTRDSSGVTVIPTFQSLEGG